MKSQNSIPTKADLERVQLAAIIAGSLRSQDGIMQPALLAQTAVSQDLMRHDEDLLPVIQRGVRGVDLTLRAHDLEEASELGILLVNGINLATGDLHRAQFMTQALRSDLAHPEENLGVVIRRGAREIAATADQMRALIEPPAPAIDPAQIMLPGIAR